MDRYLNTSRHEDAGVTGGDSRKRTKDLLVHVAEQLYRLESGDRGADT